MKSAKQKFEERMQDKEFKEMYNGQIKSIQEMWQLHPWERYQMSAASPYEIFIPGTKVFNYGVSNTGYILAVAEVKDLDASAMEFINSMKGNLPESLVFDAELNAYKALIEPKYMTPIE
jgi:hypothetical protein